jgi:WD40 repeat protein/serine/threonine protein kinase
MLAAWSGEAGALVGRSLGEFIVREPMSRGGFGLVFRAEQPGLGREAVIKILHTPGQSDGTAQRFLREAQLASRLDHPYAAHVYAFGAEPDGVLWIAMEMVRGTPLEVLLATQGPIPLDRFVPLLERICEVVHTAHEQGVIHRDLKPANVMVLSRAGRLLPKLLDFGIAKLHVDGAAPPAADRPLVDGVASYDDTQPLRLGGPPAIAEGVPTGLTGRETTLGSPHYMAPEQWRNASAADVRTDIYALGVLAYEALTGRRPFTGATIIELFNAHDLQAPPRLGSELPPALDEVVGRAMAKRPGQRFASALELASAFRDASGVSAESSPLPRLDENVRVVALAFAPRPLAHAISILDAARNPHHARDALWTAVRVTSRWLAVVALASHTHVGAEATTDPGIRDVLRRLRERTLTDAAWIDLARQLVGRFVSMRDAHPVPELVDFLTGPASSILDQLVALETAGQTRAGGTEQQVRDLLERAVPLCGRLLEALRFLASYPLWVPNEDGAEEWMGLTGARRQAPAARSLPPGRPVLVDAAGVPVVTLWPFAQVHEPLPGAAPVLFVCDGKGRRGSRLVALPDLFEREDTELWDVLGALVGETDGQADSDTFDESCPYPGLAPFTEATADQFLGRERESEAFLNRLRVTPLLAVVGPSGAGKSSFVRAGVVPGLPATWYPILVRPGPRPIDGLAARLSALGLPTGSLADALAEAPGALGNLLRSQAHARGETFVLIVDQLEELFTLCDDPAERDLYAEALARSARTSDDPVRIVLTMRDDFLLRAEAVPAFRSRLTHGLQLLATPAASDLRRILVEPAHRAGYEFDDPGLPDEIIESVASRPGALPLLSFTASKLWELRDRRFRHIGYKAYRSLGGVAGALAQHAEATLQAMPPEEQRLVREVFRHAVTAEGTRAVLTRAELDQLLGAGDHAHRVVDKLVDARLLVAAESETGEERIEVIHEALLDAWPRLVGWRRGDAEGARLRDQLRAAARQWAERGRPTGLLWRGDTAEEYRLWRARHAGALTEVEQAFGDASLAEAARGRSLRRRLILAAFVALLAVGVALLAQNRSVARERTRAVENELAVREKAEELNRRLLDQYTSQGRRLVLAEDHLQALAYLDRATGLGARSPALDLLIAQAVRATDGLELELRHDNSVARVRYAPDGTRIATASYDRQARLWDPTSGAVQARLEHGDGVLRVEFSPDGKVMATGSLDGTAALWRTRDGARLQVLAHASPVHAIQFSPDGALLATVAIDESVRLWSAVDGSLRATLRGAGAANPMPSGSVVSFSPDGSLLAVGGQDGTVQLWSVGSRRRGATLRHAHRRPVTWVAFSPDRRHLVSAGPDGNAVLWEVASRRRARQLAHKGPIHSALFSPDGARLVTASSDRTAAVWEVATGVARASLLGHAGSVNRAVFSPDGARVATVSDDGSAMVWEADSGRRLARRQGLIGSLYDVVFDPSGKHIAASSDDGAVLVWDASPDLRTTVLRGSGASVNRAVFSPRGSHIATTTADGVATVWDATTGRSVLTLDEQARGAVVVQFSPTRDELATGDSDGVIRRWDLRTGERLAQLTAHQGEVMELSWHPSSERLLTAGQDGTAAIWTMPGGQLVRRIEAHDGYPLAGAAFAPDGTSFVTSGEDRTVRRFDAATMNQVVSHSEKDGPYSVAFDARGERLVATTVRRHAVIRAADSGAVLTRLDGHPAVVSAAAFSPDGELVVTASYDGAARLFEARSGNLLAILRHSDRGLWWAAYSPEGRRVVSAGDDGNAIIWELPAYRGSAADLARLVRCRVPYEVEGDHLVQRPIDRDACRRMRSR